MRLGGLAEGRVRGVGCFASTSRHVGSRLRLVVVVVVVAWVGDQSADRWVA